MHIDYRPDPNLQGHHKYYTQRYIWRTQVRIKNLVYYSRPRNAAFPNGMAIAAEVMVCDLRLKKDFKRNASLLSLCHNILGKVLKP